MYVNDFSAYPTLRHGNLSLGCTPPSTNDENGPPLDRWQSRQ